MPNRRLLVIIFSAAILIVIVVLTHGLKSTVPLIGASNPSSISFFEANVEKYPSQISIDYLRNLKIDSEKVVMEKELPSGSNYRRYRASYISEGNKVFGLLTVPNTDASEGGYSAIVFNHGYIPPSQYVTTEKYVLYVDYLARNGFVVFKIDLRGHGESEGAPTGSYFSPGYTIDAISALKSLQKLEYVDPNKIGMWGHSMAGNLILRAALVEKDIKAVAIWAGSVYSYEDFAKYRLNDGSYVRRQGSRTYEDNETNNEVQKLREDSELIDFEDAFWSSISLTQNIDYLNTPVQLHHAINDPVVNVGYTKDLVEVLEDNGKEYESYEYPGGGHNIDSPYFEQAMQRTVDFFKSELD